MLHAAVRVSGGLGLSGLLAAATDAAGPDYQGMALLVGAISSLIATVGGLVIALRKKAPDPALQLAIRLLQEADEERGEQP